MTMMEEMASRVSTLEKSLKDARNQTSSVATSSAPASGSTVTTPRMQTGDSGERIRDDILVQEGSSSQYFNEILLSRVLEEEQHIGSALTNQATTPTPRTEHPSISPFSALGIVSSPFFTQTPSTFHPSKSVAMRLWNVYVTNVDCDACQKLLHVPTDEAKVFSTVDKPNEAPLDNHALCFAIYYCAVVALDDADAYPILGGERAPHLLSFKIGLEQALAQADYLDQPTVTSLRALAIYLAALRVNNRGRGVWVLNGLAIRLAQSIGIHRDGARLGLSPFESEIRRRLWWHLLSRDGRAGEDYGLQDTEHLLLSCDVPLPLNVDDADLYPDMKELPPERKGWTGMTFDLINIELVKAAQRLSALAASSYSSPGVAPSEDVRKSVLDQSRERIQERLRYCNPVIPQQRMTLFCASWLLRKVDFVTRQQWSLLQHHSSPRSEDFATEENLQEALELLQPRLEEGDELLKPYGWAKKAYPQYHVTMYVLWHLCIKPDGPSTGRAWRAVDTLFSTELWHETTSGYGPKSAVLEALKLKALSVRSRTQHGNPSRTKSSVDPSLNPTGDVTSAPPDSNPTDGFFANTEEFSGLGFDIGDENWPDWTTLAQGYQYDGPGSFL
ncbi:hypothetical protein LTS17_010100 [Exophiala oligosperma]